MEQVKEIISKIDFHFNAGERMLTIRYGNSSIALRITEDGKVKLETDITLEGLLGEPGGLDTTNAT